MVMKSEPSDKSFIKILGSGGLLALFAMISIGLVTAWHHFTKDQIALNQQAVLIAQLEEVFPKDRYNNSLFQDKVWITNKDLLGVDYPLAVYRARLDNKPTGVILTVVAPNGYHGPITLLVGINLNGEVTGVRAIAHHETPGLGDQLDASKSHWIEQFVGKSESNPAQTGWKTKNDDGEFDQLTGASITSRAVIDAVYHALVYYQSHQTDIFAEAEKNHGNINP